MSRFTSGCAALLAALLSSVVIAAEAPGTAKPGAESTAPAASAPDSSWQQHWELMQQRRQAMLGAKTPEERQKLMQEHWESMQGSMSMLGGCPGGGMGMGPGMMGGGMGHGMGAGQMMGPPTAEQLDQQISHVEQMLKELKAHRAEMKAPKK